MQQTDRTQIINWIAVKLSENYINAETADAMAVHIRSQLKDGKYDNDTQLGSLLKHITKDVQNISKDMHLRLLINTDMPHPQADGTEDAIPRDIIGQKRNNFQFKEVKILEGNVGYLRFDSFRNPDYAAPTAIAAMNFMANCDAVIIDLRTNGGGYAEMVQLILSYFFAEPVHYLTSYSRKDDETKEWRTLPEVSGFRMDETQVFVLTSNQFTFSAAEEFAFVIQNQDRGIVIGERTTGGAHGIDFYYLRDYAIELRIPTERIADPVSGESWEISGIEPDVMCKSKEAFEIAYALALEKLANQTSGENKEELEWLLAYQQTINNPVQIDTSYLQYYAGTFGPVTVALHNGKLEIKLAGDDKFKLLHAMSKKMFILEGDKRSRVEFDFDNENNAVALTGIRMDGRTKTFERTEPSEIILDRKSRRVSFRVPAKYDTTLLRDLEINFIYVQGGEYDMGDVLDEGSRTEIPVHPVAIDDYYMSKTEVTFAQFDRFCDATGHKKPEDEGWGRGSRPVINITWFEALEFCRWLSLKSGRFIDLPTEAEWEYAAREGGRKVRFGNGQDTADPEEINFNGDESEKKPYSNVGANREKTLPVAVFPANSLGFYDMAGNVWEYCADWYAKEYYRNSSVENPIGPDDGQYRVIRGGSYAMGPAWARATKRAAWNPKFPDKQTGFRLVMFPRK